MSYVWINGKLKKATEARVSPMDHGVITGDGLFEVLAVYESKVFALSRHINRLKQSALGMMMSIEEIEQTAWESAIQSVLQANQLSEARVRITYTTGDADLGSDRGASVPMVLIAAGAMPKKAATGKLAVVPWPRNEKGALSGLKTTSYGENVKALMYAKQKGANEALFLNTRGHVCEGTGSNVFWITQGKVFTPKLETGCLAGITRELTIKVARDLGFSVEEVEASLQNLLDAEEVFITSTLRDVQWVDQIDNKRWTSLGDGSVAHKLEREFVLFRKKNNDP